MPLLGMGVQVPPRTLEAQVIMTWALSLGPVGAAGSGGGRARGPQRITGTVRLEADRSGLRLAVGVAAGSLAQVNDGRRSPGGRRLSDSESLDRGVVVDRLTLRRHLDRCVARLPAVPAVGHLTERHRPDERVPPRHLGLTERTSTPHDRPHICSLLAASMVRSGLDRGQGVDGQVLAKRLRARPGAGTPPLRSTWDDGARPW